MHAKIIVGHRLCEGKFVTFISSYLYIFTFLALNYLVTFSMWIKREQVKCFSFLSGEQCGQTTCVRLAFRNMTSGWNLLDLVVFGLDFVQESGCAVRCIPYSAVSLERVMLFAFVLYGVKFTRGHQTAPVPSNTQSAGNVYTVSYSFVSHGRL